MRHRIRTSFPKSSDATTSMVDTNGMRTRRSLPVITACIAAGALSACGATTHPDARRSAKATTPTITAPLSPIATSSVPAVVSETTGQVVSTTSSPSGIPFDPSNDQAVIAFETGLSTIDGPQQVAAEFITAIFNGDQVTVRALIDANFVVSIDTWQTAFNGTGGVGRVIDSLVLTAAAGLATVGVSVAFPIATDGTTVDPIAYVVDMIETSHGWLVIAMGYA
jgi:hypothetical protein